MPTYHTKKTNILLFIPILILCAVLLAAGCAGVFADGEAVVYLCDGGEGDGSSYRSPIGSLEDAYAALGDGGGRIVICGGYTLRGPFAEPSHTGKVTLTQTRGYEDYRGSGSLSTGGEGRRYMLGGHTVFENIRITTQNKAGLIVMAHYNPVELGEGVECTGFDGSNTSSALTLLGGKNSGVTPVKAPSGGTHITVRSGSGIIIAGVDRQLNTKNDRVAYIDVYGGEICNLYGGNINQGSSRGSVINIYGGRFTGKVQCGLNQWEYTKVNIEGGDFSACSQIEGLASYAEVTLTEELHGTIGSKLSGFTRQMISTGGLLDAKAGDVNGDGFVSSSDISLLVRILSGSEAEPAGECDLNCDGGVNNRDAIYLIQVNAGWIKSADFGALEGDGSAESPFLISDAEDLAYLSDRVLGYASTKGVYFLQTADIKLDQKVSWTPIGTAGVPFEGRYDGGGHKIEGLYINTSRSYAGVFGFITGVVEQLDVYGSVTVHLDAAYSHSFAGGIVGGMNNGALVRGCNSYVSVTGDAYVGGVVGGVACVDDRQTTAVSRIENCTFRGTLSADGKYAKNESACYFGGIVGRVHGAVTNCVNYGDINVVGTNCRYIGGIAGFAYYSHKFDIPSPGDGVNVDGCTNLGSVTGHRETGGIVGAGAIPVLNCKNEGAVSGVRCVGGIVGVAGTAATATHGFGYTENCTNTGKVTLTQQYGGGIAGYSYFDIKGCTNTASVTGASSYAGSISGYMNGGKIS